MELRTRYTVSADGTRIAYAVIGEGEPVVSTSLAWGDLHLYSHVGLFRAMYDAWVSAGLQIALHDTRNFGASDHGVLRLDLDARLEDIDAVADAAGFETFALTAVASGAPVAIAYAARHPERVRRLVLVNGYARGEDWYRLVPAMRIVRGLLDMADDDWDTYLITTTSALTQFADPDSATAMAAAYKSSASASDYLAWVRANENVDVSGLLASIMCPTLVAVVPRMMAGGLPLARDIAAQIPNAELVELSIGPSFLQTMGAFLGGGTASAPPERAPDRQAFRTILFTDLVGHTEMMRRLGDEKGRTVLREHESLTREVLKQHGGNEVKTMGDGFLASFPSVTRGVECAIALQKAIAERNVTSDELLNVRVGLNAGEPIEEDGDLFGETVILASRITAMAKGGEILASLAVRELSAGKGFTFTSRGEHTLRGFEEPVRVFEISWKS